MFVNPKEETSINLLKKKYTKFDRLLKPNLRKPKEENGNL
jgi:hypothetical protein